MKLIFSLLVFSLSTGFSAAQTRADDVSTRLDYNAGDKASRSESDSFSIHRDLMADPYYLEKVARRNGMTAARFAGQYEGAQLQMIRAYAAEQRDLAQIKRDEAAKMPDKTKPQTESTAEIKPTQK